MPRTTFRRLAAAALLTLAFTAAAAAAPRGTGPLGAGRERTPHHHATSLWSSFLHLIGASGGTFDPNGDKR